MSRTRLQVSSVVHLYAAAISEEASSIPEAMACAAAVNRLPVCPRPPHSKSSVRSTVLRDESALHRRYAELLLAFVHVAHRDCAGFYGVTYCLGFRDDFDVQITEIIDRICDLEARANPEGSVALLEEIRNVAESYTHM